MSIILFLLVTKHIYHLSCSWTYVNKRIFLICLLKFVNSQEPW